MATIKITNLHPAGSELFDDSESYLNALTDDELNLSGGVLVPTTITTTYPWTIKTTSLTYPTCSIQPTPPERL